MKTSIHVRLIFEESISDQADAGLFKNQLRLQSIAIMHDFWQQLINFLRKLIAMIDCRSCSHCNHAQLHWCEHVLFALNDVMFVFQFALDNACSQ